MIVATIPANQMHRINPFLLRTLADPSCQWQEIHNTVFHASDRMGWPDPISGIGDVLDLLLNDRWRLVKDCSASFPRDHTLPLEDNGDIMLGQRRIRWPSIFHVVFLGSNITPKAILGVLSQRGGR